MGLRKTLYVDKRNVRRGGILALDVKILMENPFMGEKLLPDLPGNGLGTMVNYVGDVIMPLLKEKGAERWLIQLESNFIPAASATRVVELGWLA